MVLLPVFVYLNSLGNPFQYDDFHSIVDNPNIRTLDNLPRFFSDPTLFSERPESAMFRPLLLVTFAFNYAISGRETWSYHLVSIGLHALSAFLVFTLARALLGDCRSAMFSALVFGVHPVNSEAVNYISSRSEILAALFFLIALNVALHKQQSPGNLLGVLGGYCAALLSKSIAVVLPVILIARDAVFRVSRPRGQRSVMYGALVVVSGLYLIGVRAFLYRATLGEPVRPFQEQISTQIKAMVFYLKLLVVPTGLSVDHQFLISSTPFDPISGPAVLFLASLALVALLALRFQPIYLFCLIWFLTVLAPSTLIPLNVLVNEHRLYLPSVAFALMVGLVLHRFSSRRAGLADFRRLLPLVFVVFLGWVTAQRNQVWGSVYGLWEDAASKAPLMARPHIFLGDAHYKRGHLQRAVEEFEIAVDRDPGFVPAYLRLAELYLTQGDRVAAEAVLRRGAAADPASADPWVALGEQLRAQGELGASRDAYLKAVALAPEDTGIRNNLGNIYQLLEEPNKALGQHLRALEGDPLDARTWLNAGNAYLMLRDHEKAEAAYSEALRLNPEYSEAWLNLGGLYARLGQNEDARRAFDRAAAIKSTAKQHAPSN